MKQDIDVILTPSLSFRGDICTLRVAVADSQYPFTMQCSQYQSVVS